VKINLPSYTQHYGLSPIKTQEDAYKYNFSFVHDVDADYSIYWGLPTTKLHMHKKFGVMESGFFWDGMFIDTVGSYQNSSLNTKMGYDAVKNFKLGSRKSAKEIIFSKPINQQSKYNAVHGTPEQFSQKIVLACQNHKDRSIGYPHNQDKYYEFIESCCKYYGKDLFVKLHPWNTNENADFYLYTAKKYNCSINKCHMGLLKNAEFVISFNSTIAIDCVLMDVPYYQYAMGTFWNAFGVNFTGYKLPKKIKPVKDAHKLADFLIYKYCYSKKMSQDKYANMLRHFARSSEIFPMTKEFCYAEN
tara:strand:+ start:590 stop:1498 length:909 start_codon:yes stop_codon:yes gene_type:complete